MTFNLVAPILAIVSAVVILWYISVAFLDHKRFIPLLPLFLWAIFRAVLASFTYYDQIFTFWWWVLDFLFVLVYALLLVILIRFCTRP